jgi:pimeloyl-ACP methyl ester carboxylesterase
VRLQTALLMSVILMLITFQFQSAQAQDNEVRFETVECRFETFPWGETICGDLIVPENRHNPDNQRTVRLHVAVLKALQDDPFPDPVIYLEGGPGGNQLQLLRDNFELQSLNYKRDVIIFDQRGTGLSEPALNCPLFYESIQGRLHEDLSMLEYNKIMNQDHRTCHDDLRDQDIDLSGYNSVENAADVADLRIALGYDEWNIFGVSYGTRLALEVMRNYPEGIRSVILDSPAPPQVNWLAELPANVNRAFDLLFAACQLNYNCSEDYPDLEAKFYAMVAELNANPVSFEFTFEGEDHKVMIRGDIYIEMLFSKLYNQIGFLAAPRVIDQALKGNHTEAGIYRLLYAEQNLSFTTGMYYTFVCADMLAESSYEVLRLADDAYPLQQAALDMGYFEDICAIWDVPLTDEANRTPVYSDLPVLVLSGGFDPITPPAYGRITAETLSSSFYFLFPEMGHGLGFNACGRAIMLEFLSDPETAPDASCIAAIPPIQFTPPRRD